MKTFLVALLTAFVCSANAQTDCHPFVPYTVGTKWEITNYSDKGKETGKISYELVDKTETGNDVTFTIKSVAYDKKGKETLTNEFKAFCKDGKFEFDMAFKMDATAMQSYENMDMQMDASELDIPSMDTPPGTALNDGTLEAKVGTGGMTMFTMKVLLTERKVEAKEKITTPAGTFDCIRLSQKVSMKMMVNVEGSSKEWYAEGIGMVRSESFDKKGQMNGYSVLTKLEKK